MITVSTNKAKLNLPFIHNCLKKTYFGKDFAPREVKTAIEHSFCFGLYVDEEQIGFARVLTDYVTFAAIMDVVIAEEQRGKGNATILLNAVVNDEELQNVLKWQVETKNEHFLFEKFGFQKLAQSDTLMEKTIQR